jgi:Protein of unknown function (DUF1566)
MLSQGSIPKISATLMVTLLLSVALCQAAPGKQPLPLAGTSQPAPALAAKTAHYIDNKNGTVSDKTHGLMWKKCSEGQSWRKAGNSCDGKAAGISWDDALNQIEILNAGNGFAGFKDWRLPTVKELATLVEYDRPSPIDLSLFPATPSLWYWSSTPYQRQATRAWFVAFGSGDISIERIDNQSLHVRLVRSER